MFQVVVAAAAAAAWKRNKAETEEKRVQWTALQLMGRSKAVSEKNVIEFYLRGRSIAGYG